MERKYNRHSNTITRLFFPLLPMAIGAGTTLATFAMGLSEDGGFAALSSAYQTIGAGGFLMIVASFLVVLSARGSLQDQRYRAEAAERDDEIERLRQATMDRLVAAQQQLVDVQQSAEDHRRQHDARLLAIQERTNLILEANGRANVSLAEQLSDHERQADERMATTRTILLDRFHEQKMEIGMAVGELKRIHGTTQQLVELSNQVLEGLDNVEGKVNAVLLTHDKRWQDDNQGNDDSANAA